MNPSTHAMTDSKKEFELTEKDFKFVQWFIHKNAGIHLTDQKYAMVYGRVSRKMREKGVARFADYRKIIERSDSEQMAFVNALTTNKTSFFREKHHFDFLEKTLVPKWIEQRKQEVRIWSAGCSTGEEPYSYMAALNHASAFEHFSKVALLATDLDTNVLAHAKAGVYDEEAIDSIPKPYLKGNFVKGKGEFLGKIKCAKKLQQQVAFKQLNLLENWPMTKKFDLISCRNVMIYFDKPTQKLLIERFCQQLNEGGSLFIGHSESVGADCQLFEHLGNTIYLKL
ncbi:protein-glutamate O-methyltransferase CheR [Vibrio sp. 99-70-13A1]|uniref:CheR family methyltransferase n=1 Tax=Vibrio sp. 99-70-13A1 TaxID=2607601 RepID=UPI0020A4E7FE|nr:protein-glutamate O-methyltransferase CheR [Vibrio sp. 99-70-13A1]